MKAALNDWVLIIPIILIMLIGLITNYPIDNFSSDSLFFKQSIFVFIGTLILIFGSRFKYSILKGPFVTLILFASSLLVLLSLLFFAPEINGANSWFVFSGFAIQPVEFVKIVLVIILARYFTTRHRRIKHIQYVIVSLLITSLFFLLVFLQPDLGSSVVLLFIWAGMIFISGVSKKHILALFLFAIAVSAIGWNFMPQYQQERVLTFLAPFENLQSSGYNAYQSKVAIGSGEIIGKGIGEGTQSKLGFLPLYESDFVFAAFSEEWGFAGVLILFLLYFIIGVRLFLHSIYARTNFETLYTVGIFVFIFTHVILHIGVNIGVLPVTGITLPFMSYGGSHIIAETLAIAIVLGLSRTQFAGKASELRDIKNVDNMYNV